MNNTNDKGNGMGIKPVEDLAVREYGEKYDQLLQAIPAAIYTTDAEGYIESYNEAAVILWGQTPKAGKDRWCGSWKIYRIDGSPLTPEQCPMAISLQEKRPVYGEKIIIEGPDGTKRYVAAHPRPIFDKSGALVGGVNILLDLTDLHALNFSLSSQVDLGSEKMTQRTSELKRSEERYHKMIEEVEDYAIILLDKEGTIQNWNKGAEKIKGYKEEEIIGSSFQVFYRLEDQKNNVPQRLLEAARIKGKEMHEGWRVRKDRTMFWGSVVITALHDDENNVVGFSKVTRDLTERKMAEDRMREYARELEFQNRELQQFAFVAAHDMKEPLRKIQLYTTSVLETLKSQIPEKEKEYLSRTAEAVLRMQQLIDDILTYSRTSVSNENMELVDLQQLLIEIRNPFETGLSKTNVVITFDGLPTVSGIPFQLRQLFDNLIGNAVKYRHPDRTPHIQIGCEKIVSPFFQEQQESNTKLMYKISVSDNGIGFEQKYAEKIFEMFNRLHTRYHYPGTGIGLALCRKIAQNHKGNIIASGIPDKGAIFNVYLPV